MEFIVEGDPQGKARPRFSQKSGTVYTPAKTAKYEKLIREAFITAGGKAIPADCYVKVIIKAYFKIPKSFSKKRKALCEENFTKPAKRPDLDNCAKVVLDALNGVAYKDDAMVTTLAVCKRYTSGAGMLKIRVLEDKE